MLKNFNSKCVNYFNTLVLILIRFIFKNLFIYLGKKCLCERLAIYIYYLQIHTNYPISNKIALKSTLKINSSFFVNKILARVLHSSQQTKNFVLKTKKFVLKQRKGKKKNGRN